MLTRPFALVSLFLLPPPADAWLGIFLDLEHDQAVVAEVIPDSPAAKAGLLAGDVLLAVGDRTMASREEFIAAIQGQKAGDRVSLRIRRGDKESTVVVQLGARPNPPTTNPATTNPARGTEGRGSAPAAPSQPEPAAPASESRAKAGPRIGSKPKPTTDVAKASTSAPSERGYLRVRVRETAEGVAIESLLAGSPAKAASAAVGDVITSVQSQAIQTVADLDRELKRTQPGQRIALGLRRGDAARSVLVTLVGPVGGSEVVAAEVVEVPSAPLTPKPPAPRTAKARPGGAGAADVPAGRSGEVDLASELASLRQELAELRRQLEELRRLRRE